jgi:hypothetical protein
MERGRDGLAVVVLFLVQVKTLQNGNGGWAPARIEWLVNASGLGLYRRLKSRVYISTHSRDSVCSLAATPRSIERLQASID